ncbi:MAG: NAD-dependent epimerase/dehydratase family protein [Candidatus Methylacidiphilales bacterium]|nr:NAD-dependent epimerase/dehydratase family protein [Candidatus Methylacidiphilales bacterium]
MKHLVTGGSGFLGNLIARRLLAKGETVKVLDIWKDPSLPAEIEYIDCDIRNRDGVRAAMRGIDIVHHNVALVPLTKSGAKFWEVNVDGSRIAAECAVAAGVKAFIHMSSSAIYGVPDIFPIDEKTPYEPVEIYGRAKLAGEQQVREVCEKAGMPLIVIRPRTILGEGRLGIFQILFDWIHENAPIFVIGDGQNKFQFVQAHDLMDAYMLALDSQHPGAYNVGTDRFGTLEEALQHVIAHAGSTSRVRHLPVTPAIGILTLADKLGVSPLAPWHYLTYHKPYYFDLAPLKALGWKPRYSNDEMFRESYDWFLANHLGKSDETKDGAAGFKQTEKRSAHRKRVPEGILWLAKKLFS